MHKTYLPKHSLACSIAHAMIEGMKDFEHITKYVLKKKQILILLIFVIYNHFIFLCLVCVCLSQFSPYNNNLCHFFICVVFHGLRLFYFAFY